MLHSRSAPPSQSVSLGLFLVWPFPSSLFILPVMYVALRLTEGSKARAQSLDEALSLIGQPAVGREWKNKVSSAWSRNEVSLQSCWREVRTLTIWENLKEENSCGGLGNFKETPWLAHVPLDGDPGEIVGAMISHSWCWNGWEFSRGRRRSLGWHFQPIASAGSSRKSRRRMDELFEDQTRNTGSSNAWHPQITLISIESKTRNLTTNMMVSVSRLRKISHENLLNSVTSAVVITHFLVPVHPTTSVWLSYQTVRSFHFKLQCKFAWHLCTLPETLQSFY